MLDYPKVTLPNSESFLYWQSAKFGFKPTIRINHLTISEQPTHVAVVSKMLYASHYFWTAIELRVLVPDPARGEGFWFVSVNRSRSDGLSGFSRLADSRQGPRRSRKGFDGGAAPEKHTSRSRRGGRTCGKSTSSLDRQPCGERAGSVRRR